MGLGPMSGIRLDIADAELSSVADPSGVCQVNFRKRAGEQSQSREKKTAPEMEEGASEEVADEGIEDDATGEDGSLDLFA